MPVPGGRRVDVRRGSARGKVVTAPRLAPVESSSIAAIGYSATERALWVQFVSGRTYRYADVPKDVHEEFLRADSKGRYFNSEIRDSYAFTEV